MRNDWFNLILALEREYGSVCDSPDDDPRLLKLQNISRTYTAV